MYIKDNGAAIAQALRDNTAAAVSDGPYDDDFQIGTSAFIIVENIRNLPQDMPDIKGTFHNPSGKGYRRSPDNDNTIRGANQVPGSPEHQSAYRSELAGILGILITLQELC